MRLMGRAISAITQIERFEVSLFGGFSLDVFSAVRFGLGQVSSPMSFACCVAEFTATWYWPRLAAAIS